MVKLASHYLRLYAEHQSALSCVSALHCVNLAFSRLLAQRVRLNAQLLCLLADMQHTVETGIACHCDAVDVQRAQQVLALSVLHIEMGEAPQHTGIALAIPLEEYLPLPEDA